MARSTIFRIVVLKSRCFLAITAADEERLWGQAVGFPTLPGVRPAKPTDAPWLAAGLLPDGMVLLGDFPELMVELDDLERCVRVCSRIGCGAARRQDRAGFLRRCSRR